MNAARVLPARCAVVAFQPAALSRSLHVLSRTVADRRNRKPFRVCADAATSNPLETVINGITVLLKNSPLNAGKKALAIAQAGDYDVQGTKAKLDQLIAENPVMPALAPACNFCFILAKHTRAASFQVCASPTESFAASMHLLNLYFSDASCMYHQCQA